MAGGSAWGGSRGRRAAAEGKEAAGRRGPRRSGAGRAGRAAGGGGPAPQARPLPLFGPRAAVPRRALPEGRGPAAQLDPHPHPHLPELPGPGRPGRRGGSARLGGAGSGLRRARRGGAPARRCVGGSWASLRLTRYRGKTAYLCL